MGFKIPLTNIILFVLTVITTVWCGSALFGGSLFAGMLYSLTVLIILFTHEMGHYINARRHGLDVTLPYFIPIPIGIGTMGAVIKMKSMANDRNALMDVGAAGPLWGFVASFVMMAIGIAITPVYDSPLSKMLGASLLYTAMSYIIKGVPPEFLAINPVIFAAWLGFFVTMLNLLPIGQLDGGHVTYAMFGKAKNFRKYMQTFFYCFIAWGIVCMFVYHSPTWIIFSLLLLLLGGSYHPPLNNEMIDLNLKNRIKGWACVIIFILTVMPSPFRT